MYDENIKRKRLRVKRKRVCKRKEMPFVDQDVKITPKNWIVFGMGACIFDALVIIAIML